MTFSLYLIGFMIFLTLAGNLVLKNLEEKTDISLYFNYALPEEQILEVKKDLEKDDRVSFVEYISKEAALASFKKENANEPVILEALEEIGENPLLASLIIKAKDPNQFQSIYESLEKYSWKEELSRVNYEKNKELIEKITALIRAVQKIGLILGIIFGLISVLIVFNAIRLTIYSQGQEVEIMRLVGASNSFIRLPYLFEGFLYGFFGSIFATFLIWLSLKIADPYFSTQIFSQNLSSLFWQNWKIIFSFELIAGIFLGIFSSLIAIRKYLKA